MLQTVEAMIDAKGQIHWLEDVRLTGEHRVLVTILDAPSAEDATHLLAEPALTDDWLNDEEDAAWAHLQLPASS